MGQFDDKFRPRGSNTGEALSASSIAETLRAIRGQRTLVVLPESHLESVASEAMTLAENLATFLPDRKIAIFFEAVRNTAEGSKPKEQPISTVGLGTVALNDLYFPLAFVNAAAGFCRISAVNGNPRHPKAAEVVNEFIAKTLLYKALHGKSGQVSILDIQELAITEVHFAAFHLRDRAGIAPEQIMPALEQMPDTDSGRIPPRLSDLMLSALASITSSKLDACRRFRAELLRALNFSCPAVEANDITAIKTSVFKRDAFQADAKSSKTLEIVRTLREHSLPYFILKEPFDVGVYNCGLNHAASPIFEAAMKNAGVRVMPLVDPMLRRSFTTDLLPRDQ